MRTTALRAVLLALTLASFPTCLLRAQGTPIGFIEDFALASDREAALAKLVPGTADEYYYRCLHAQNTGAFEDVDALLPRWIQRYGRSDRVRQIENRQALLTFDRSPEQTYRFLRNRLDLRFDHQRNLPGAVPDLPTELDPELIAYGRLTNRALSKKNTLAGFRDRALPQLAARGLEGQRLAQWLERLRRPDVPNLPALVVRALGQRNAASFGRYAIHGALLLDQLDQCAQLRPALLDDTNFIQCYLRRLEPSPDIDWTRDAAAREAYLDRLEAFARRLSPAHNSLKANILYHRLVHDLAAGTPNIDRFTAYLRLPRTGPFVRTEHVRRVRRGAQMVNPADSFRTGFGSIGNDEPLLRAHFWHFFREASSPDRFREFVSADQLRRIFAEVKLLAGAGDMERWHAMLDDPAYYEQLERRVEIEFAPTQKTFFRRR